MKKLKNIDFKALFINHGEKFGFVIIVLIVLGALSSTSWSRYEKTPEELKTKITEAKDRITSPANKWPQAKADQFVIVDFNGKARDVFTGLQTAKYEFTTPLFWPLYRKKEKAREPDLSVAQLLIASPGLAVLGISNQPAMPQGETSADSSKLGNEPVPDSNLKPGPGGPAAGSSGGAGPGGVPFGMSTAGAPAGVPKSGGRPGGGPGPGHGSSAGPGSSSSSSSGMGMPGMDMYGAGGMGGGMTARGKRYVAVRAVVPIKEQIERAMRALNMSYADASAAIEYTDFTLERQTAVAGSDPWSGEWEVVKKEYAIEVLQECADFDPDPVPADLQDAVFTMPLPLRLLRYWADDATHPSIKNFQLSEAEMERERALHARLVEEAEKLNLQSQPKVQKKGLTSVVNDMRGIAKSVTASSEGSAFMSGMAKFMNEGSNGPKMGIPDIQNRLTASGRLYLFRYFDFDVQPGMAYRYRLKLELKNPNFERSYDEVENADFTRGPYRETGWSNISNAAVVPDTVHYFLKDVERDPVREEKHGKKPVANIAMFEWDAKLGTMLSDTLRILSVGQFIAEKKKSWVLDPATPSFEEKDVPFVTEDVLVDATGDLELSADLHPDLQLKPERGKKDVKVGALPEALVATGVGTLKELDPLSEIREEQALKQKVDEERKNFLYLKDAPKESSSALDGAIPGMSSMPGGSSNMSSGRGRNPLKKGGAGGPGGAHGSSESTPGGSSGGRPKGKPKGGV